MLHGGVGNRAGRLAAQGYHRDTAVGDERDSSVVVRIGGGTLIDGLSLIGNQHLFTVGAEGDHIRADPGIKCTGTSRRCSSQ